MIISAYSKGSNSSGFNLIWQKFWEMICEIIVYKTMSGVFLIFCRSSFINNFIVKNHFLEHWHHRNLNILKPIYLIKIYAHRFEDHICANKVDNFFFLKKSFLRTWNFFSRLQNHWFGLHFFPQKTNFILIFKCDHLILIQYEKHALRIY